MKDKIMDRLLNISTKIQNQKYMTAIKNGFTIMFPLIIIGSFCTLFTNIICSTKEGAFSLANIQGMAWLAKFEPIFSATNYATMNLLALYAVIFIAYELAKHYQLKDKITCAAVAFAAYITLCATIVSVTIEGSTEPVEVANVLSSTYTGVQGLFLAMIVAVIATELYRITSKVEKFKIHMPDSVPSNIAAAFNALIPGLIVIFSISAFGCIFDIMIGMTLFEAINLVIQKPLQGLLTGLPGYLFIFFMTTVLWFFGIHGTQVLKPIYQAALIAAVAENAEAIANGGQATNILNDAFRASFTTITGAGVTGGLIIAIFIFSKRDDWKAIAKLGIPCAIFNINEPIIFGLPIVLNPILGIPFVLAPICTATFGYFMTKIGFASVMTVISPWTTPAGIQAVLNSAGHLGTAITQLLAIGISFLVYSPFVIAANKMKDNKNGGEN